MTIYEISQEIYTTAVGHFINGEKVDQKWIRTYLQSMFRAGGHVVTMEIALLDGKWLFNVYKHDEDQYSMFIPDTREQEVAIKKRFL